VDDLRPTGRDAEIAEISAFLSATSGAPGVLAITGEAGIGKTTVWKQVIQRGCASDRLGSWFR
jgi:predicted ATPase